MFHARLLLGNMTLDLGLFAVLLHALRFLVPFNARLLFRHFNVLRLGRFHTTLDFRLLAMLHTGLLRNFDAPRLWRFNMTFHLRLLRNIDMLLLHPLRRRILDAGAMLRAWRVITDLDLVRWHVGFLRLLRVIVTRHNLLRPTALLHCERLRLLDFMPRRRTLIQRGDHLRIHRMDFVRFLPLPGLTTLP